MENGEEKKEIVKGKVENWKWKGKKYENEERTFFFSLLLLLFACHFLKPLKFVLSVPKWKFLPGKSISCWEKIRKSDFAAPPRKKYSSHTTAY